MILLQLNSFFRTNANILWWFSLVLWFDITRILSRFMRSTLSGIDRVEYAYLKEICEKPHPFTVEFVITTPWFSGLINSDRVRDIFPRLEHTWGIYGSSAADLVYLSLKNWLERPLLKDLTACARFQGKSTSEIIRRDMINLVRDIIRAGTRLERRLIQFEQRKGVYLNVSHLMLDAPQRFKWAQNNNIQTAFLLHDTIPIDFPEFCRPGAAEQHLMRLKTVASLNSKIIVNSQFTKKSIKHHFGQLGIPNNAVKVAPLAVSECFIRSPHSNTPDSLPGYFICVGTIEPRKNLAFLLSVWRNIVAILGENAPRLVIVGRRGWKIENIIDILERASSVAPFVAEVSDLTDAGLADLISGALAVLAPSTVEGFGLPVIEALAGGVPVIASNIEAHREAGAAYATYIDPLDGLKWISTILEFAQSESSVRYEAVVKARTYVPLRWPQHVNGVFNYLMHGGR